MLGPVLDRSFNSVGICLLLALAAAPLQAQLVVKLSPETVSQFDQYAKTVESELAERWSNKASDSKKPFLTLDADPSHRDKLLAGQIEIQPVSGTNPISIKDGLIHDWVGAVFIPETTVSSVIAILKDFDHHAEIYPEVTQSKVISRSGPTVTGFWRLEQKGGLVPIKLDVTEEATYQQITPERWKGTTYARNIIETDTTPFGRGKQFPLGQGHGYLWRFYAYWSIQSQNNGVLAECRSLSLSRDVPPALSWAIAPYVEKQPREALNSTLANTRKAARAHSVVAAGF